LKAGAKGRSLPVAARQRRHLVRYVGAGQARFGRQKRHLDSESLRWRLYILLVFTAMVAMALRGLLRELG
jgi:hypothetical protein